MYFIARDSRENSWKVLSEPQYVQGLRFLVATDSGDKLCVVEPQKPILSDSRYPHKITVRNIETGGSEDYYYVDFIKSIEDGFIKIVSDTIGSVKLSNAIFNSTLIERVAIRLENFESITLLGETLELTKMDDILVCSPKSEVLRKLFYRVGTGLYSLPFSLRDLVIMNTYSKQENEEEKINNKTKRILNHTYIILTDLDKMNVGDTLFFSQEIYEKQAFNLFTKDLLHNFIITFNHKNIRDHKGVLVKKIK